VEPLGEQDPREIGPFTVLARLAAGDVGPVYLARSPSGRTVDVTLLHPHLAGDREARERFAG